MSTHPDTGYHYFYFRVKYNNTDSPKLYAYNRLFHRPTSFMKNLFNQ